MTAAEDLTKALLSMAERGERPRCGDGATAFAWTSEDPDERAVAASWCAGCPLAEVCWAAAVEVNATHGVWAGRDATDPDVQKQIRREHRAHKKESTR